MLEPPVGPKVWIREVDCVVHGDTEKEDSPRGHYGYCRPLSHQAGRRRPNVRGVVVFYPFILLSNRSHRLTKASAARPSAIRWTAWFGVFSFMLSFRRLAAQRAATS